VQRVLALGARVDLADLNLRDLADGHARDLELRFLDQPEGVVELDLVSPRRKARASGADGHGHERGDRQQYGGAERDPLH
jgi:hypothetical protein